MNAIAEIKTIGGNRNNNGNHCKSDISGSTLPELMGHYYTILIHQFPRSLLPTVIEVGDDCEGA